MVDVQGPSPRADLGAAPGREDGPDPAVRRRPADGLPHGSPSPPADELRILSRAAVGAVPDRGLSLNPFRDWDDALETLARASRPEPLLRVLDEFPELAAVAPGLPGVIRAAWDRLAARSNLRLLLCGSAVRTMQAVREERAPLYGRIDLSLLVHPFRPHEAAAMLPRLRPVDRAVVWGIVGGMPLYLRWWDQGASVRRNLERLACEPGAPLLTEGQLVLSTEGEAGDLARQVLHAIATGRTKHHEIEDAVGADPARTLERLTELRLVERLVPVTEDPRRTRRRVYRIADNFVAFWLGILGPHVAEIERGLGAGILPVLPGDLDRHMGPRFEEAFRSHLRRLAEAGELGPEVVAIGPFWTAAMNPWRSTPSSWPARGERRPCSARRSGRGGWTVPLWFGSWPGGPRRCPGCGPTSASRSAHARRSGEAPTPR